MTLQQLRYIVALADLRHFARAAEACHVSQSTLSIQLKKLEESLSLELFDRSLKRVTPTPVGREIVTLARSILSQVERIRELAKSQSADPMARTLRLGVIPTVAPYLLPQVLPMVHRVHPRLRLLLRELTTAELLDALHGGELDAAILSPPFPQGGLERMALYHEPFLAALPADSALAARKRITLDALVAAGLLLLQEGHCLRDQALSVCGQAAGHNEEVKATSLEMLRQMVASGIGCTLMPALAASTPGVADDARVAIRPLKTPVPGRDIVLTWRSRSVTEDTVRGFGETLQTYLPAGVKAARSGGRANSL